MRLTVTLLCLVFISISPCLAQWERTTEQIPDLQSLPDMTSELQAQIDNNGGRLLLIEKNYRITSTLEFDLKKLGAAAVKSIGGATIIMGDELDSLVQDGYDSSSALIEAAQ